MKLSGDKLRDFIVILARKVAKEDISEFDKELVDIVENEKFDQIEVEFTNPDEDANTLALFFTPFIDKDALFSKDAQKIRESLSIYPDEIKEAIIKSLEMLSMVKLLKYEDKIKILSEVFNTILVLYKFFIRLADEV